MRTILVLLSLVAVSWARQQSAGARGQLMCGNQPLTDATVMLCDLNTWPIPDTMLSKVKTDSNGRFQVSGTTKDVTTMDPTIKFYHKCNKKFNIPKLCKRKIIYDIPKKYITNGQNVDKWYEMGTLNMEAKLRKKQTACIGK